MRFKSVFFDSLRLNYYVKPSRGHAHFNISHLIEPPLRGQSYGTQIVFLEKKKKENVNVRKISWNEWKFKKKRWIKISTHPNFSVILDVKAVPLIREKYLFVTCVKSFLLQATIIPGFARQKRIVLYIENSFLRSSCYLQLNQVSDVHTKLIFVLVAQRLYRHIGVSIVFLLNIWWNNLQEFNIGAKK